MTITAAPSEVSYAGDGSSTVFPIPFVFDISADLEVVVTDPNGNTSTLTTGFSVSGGSGSTGSLTLSAPPGFGSTITILDNPAITQDVDYVANDAFPADAHERALDRCVRICKRLYQLIQKSVRVADGDPSAGTDVILSSVQNRRGKYLFFNAITGALEYATAVNTTVLSQSVIAPLLFPQTQAETTAGVTPADYSVISHDKCGYFLPERYAVNAVPGTTVMQIGVIKAIAVAVAAGGGTVLGSSHYKMTGPCATAVSVDIFGMGDGCWFDFPAGHGFTIGWTGGNLTGTTLDNFKITGAGAGDYYAIYQAGTLNDADEVDGLKIRNLRISHWNVGIKLRTVRNLELVGDWIQNVDRGIELAGACIVTHWDRLKIIKAAGGGGSGSSIGVTLTSFNYTSGSGTVYCEGGQIAKSLIYGFDTAISAQAENYLNLDELDIQATKIGIDISTSQFVLNITNFYIQLDGAAAQYGIIARALGAPISITKINIQNFGIRATSLVAGSVGIRFEDAQKNYTIKDGIIDGFHTNDIQILTSRAGLIDNVTCQSTNPTNSIEALTITAGPVRIENTNCTKAIGYTAADVASGKLIVGPNSINAGTLIGGKLYGSATYDPASLADGVGATTTVTVTGAALGDTVEGVSFSLDLQGITLTAWVSSANTVSVRFQNESGGILDLASGTLRAIVRQRTAA